MTRCNLTENQQLPNHFVCAQQQGLRDGKVLCSRRLEVDHKPHGARLLDRKVGGFCPLQHTIAVFGDTDQSFPQIGRISEDATHFGKGELGVDRGQPRRGDGIDNGLSIGVVDRAAEDAYMNDARASLSWRSIGNSGVARVT